MGIAERREREKEALRTGIVEAARDILSEQGLDALSMRAIADRIEYSPATIYTYFRDKDELIRNVVYAGFKRMHEYMRDELIRVGDAANSMEEFGALGRAYALFALENTAYFRVMFELPSVAQMECPGADSAEGVAMMDEQPFDSVVNTMREAVEMGLVAISDPVSGALVGWGMMHGLTSLYLGGHLRDSIQSHEQFVNLIEEAQRSLYVGWMPRGAETGGSADEEVAEPRMQQTS
ncbi:TetR/AcrR family transcriptional regulator [soil metagenome]|nr:TetR/AcrR family transcriptional regulator [Gemmatimonadota bacterium]